MQRLLLSLSILCLLACGSPSNMDTQMAMVPAITMVAPVSGSMAGGTEVTITGTNFDDSTQTVTVRFGNNIATVKSASATQVVVTTPAGGPGIVDVVVVNGSSGLSASLAGGFFYWSPGLNLIAGGLGGYGNVDGTGAAARFISPSSVAVDGAGNLYVADTGNRTIRKVVVATGVVTTLAGSAGLSGSTDGIGAAARFASPVGMALDGAGNLYVADSLNHAIRKVVVATGVVTTIAGGMRGSTDGTGTAARFSEPIDVALDGVGNLYVADRLNHTIRKVVVATGAVTTLAGSAGLFGSTDGTGTAARFRNPGGVAVDGAGNLYVADSLNHTIRKLVVASGVVTTLAGSPGISGFSDGIPTAALFSNPEGMALDGVGNLYVADRSNHAIRKVVVATGVVTILAGFGMAGSTDGTGPGASFNRPRGVAVDGAGHLYVADSNSHTIRNMVVATGVVTTFAGSAGVSGSIDGTGPDARFSGPQGVAVDGAGNLYVADRGNHTIRKVVVATGVVTTLAGTYGMTGSTDGTGPGASFYFPEGVAVDDAGNLYVADSVNGIIRKVVVATGVVTTLAGSARMYGSTDGIGAAARFNHPSGMAVDGAGNLYVADGGTIRKVVVATGVVTTLAGSAGIFGSTDGIGTAARFTSPSGVAVDGAGNLYVAESGNHTIRKVKLTSGSVSTHVGVAGQFGVQPGLLPARLNCPTGLAALPSGELFLVDSVENAVLAVY